MEAEWALGQLEAKWDAKFPSVSQIWRRNWERITPFFNYPAEIRRAIYTTNAIESLNRSLRKVIKTRIEAACFWGCGRRRRNGPCRFITGGRR